MALCQLGGRANSAWAAVAPKIFVMITVDHLREDFLEALMDEMPSGGWQWLREKGCWYSDVQHPLLRADAVASEAIIQTGTLASANSIAEAQPLLRLNEGGIKTTLSVLEDPDYMGYATADRRSPRALSALTLSDQIKQSSGGTAKVYAIAPNAEEAIIAGGQMADGVFWLDSYSGRWVTSTYYREGMPWYIEQLNSGKEGTYGQVNAGTLRWTPLYDSTFRAKYECLPIAQHTGSFDHKFNKSDIHCLLHYKHSPLVNDAVLQVAERLLHSSEIGNDEIADFLSLHLTLNVGDKAHGSVTPEVIDAYYRLDRTLAHLLQALDQKVGLKNTIIAVMGNGMSTGQMAIRREERLFHLERTKALINMYLSAQYGQENWVTEVTDRGGVYLNRPLIARQKGNVTLHALQSAVSDFLMDFSGVRYTITDHQLREGAILNQENRLWQTALNNAVPKHRADVFFDLLPGWSFEETSNGVVSSRVGTIPTCLVIYHPNQEAKQLHKPIDLRAISKEISRVLRIRPPTN